MSYSRTRFSTTTGQASAGIPPNELWGVSNGPKERKREAARAKDVTLKAYLRSVEKKP